MAIMNGIRNEDIMNNKEIIEHYYNSSYNRVLLQYILPIFSIVLPLWLIKGV